MSARQRRAKAQQRKRHAAATRPPRGRSLASATLGGVLATSLALGVAGTAKAATAPLGAATKLGAANTAKTISASEIRNIDTVPHGGRPSHITDVGGIAYFTAYDPAHGQELWTSDGTAAGTTLVKDVDGGSIGSYPADLTDVNGTLYFRANDGSSGYELWKSDGTAAGTALVKDIRSGSASSYPSSLTNVNGTLYFSADDGTYGKELWKSDGTTAGTVLVQDINPGYSGSGPSSLTNVSGTLFFSANDGTNGTELWKSDGSAAGTVLVKDINPGPFGSFGGYSGVFADVNGTLFFSANDGTYGKELWKSDGTAAGTVLVKDINPGPGSGLSVSGNPDLTNVGGTLFFSANDGTYGRELWKSDGSAAGTVLVKDINPGAHGSLSSYSNALANVNGTLFFGANDGTNGYELWKSDGTSAGTTLVKDINPSASYPRGSYPSHLTNLNGTLFFGADDGTTGSELWKSDGTTAGTVEVTDINPGSAGSMGYYLTNVGGTLFFDANDGSTGSQLWKSDGTAAGTAMVSAIDGGDGGSYPGSVIDVNGALFFAANDGTHGSELWKSNGTAAGTVLLKDINPGTGYLPGSYPDWFTDVNGTLYFVAYDGSNGSELWKSDGTTAGTVLVKDIHSGSASSFLSSLTNVNGTLFFSADDGTYGKELWKSDGTAAGTVLVKDINPGSGDSKPTDLTNVNGTLFFSADDGTHGSELWKSDGTSAGTVMVKDINPYAGYGPGSLTNVDGTVFFIANDGSTGRELWKSDGSAAGTVRVTDIHPGGRSSFYGYESPLTNVNGTLFFSANDGTTGYELWKSDGTTLGTTMVRDINPGGRSSIRYLSRYGGSIFANVAGTLFFSANDGTDGYELWKSDGTAAGTVLVKDINPQTGYYGGYGSNPDSLTNVNGTLFFAANDGSAGRELWQSDGTTAGTELFADIRPGNAGSFPGNFTSVSGALVFSANDGETGNELWKAAAPADPTTTGVSCAPSSVTTGNASACTVTVADTAASGATTPVGSVSLTRSPVTGNLGNTSCTLIPKDGSSATCSVTFTPTAADSYTITGAYTGDLGHDASSGSGSVTATPPHATSTDVSCAPSSVTTGTASSCTVTVADTVSSGGTTPTGTVAFTGNLGNTSCTLTTKDATSGSCNVTFTPTAAGSYTITGNYGGDSGHNTSSGSGSLTGTAPPARVVSVGNVTVSRTKAEIKITCAGAVGQDCPITLRLKAKVKKHHKPVVVGTARESVAAGATTTVDVSLNAAGKKALKKHGKLHVTLTVSDHGTTIATKHLTFKKH